ncbi:MAG: HEAT repeat domain-containing protein, partial [Calditrichaeota bacterium]
SIEHKHHHDVVIEFLAKNGKKNIDVVGKGIYDKRADVVINAIRVLAQIGDDKSLHYLSKVAEHRDESIRLALVESLKDSPNDKVLPILKRIVIDSSREIGRSAVEAIVSHRGKPAFDTITDIINSDSFVSLDHSDQQSLLVAYSKLGSEEAVSYLVQIARTFNIFRNSSMMFFRMAALEALSVNKSEKCERELLKLSKSLRPSLKKQAQQALRKRREYIYGIDEK